MTTIKPSHYILGILAFVFVIMSGTALIAELQTSNSDFASDSSYEDFNDTFNVYNDVTDSVGDIQSGIEDAEPDMGAFGVLNSLIQSSWHTLRLLFSSFGFMNGVFNGLHDHFGIPSFVGGLLILAVAIIFAFSIFSAVFQRDL